MLGLRTQLSWRRALAPVREVTHKPHKAYNMLSTCPQLICTTCDFSNQAIFVVSFVCALPVCSALSAKLSVLSGDSRSSLDDVLIGISQSGWWHRYEIEVAGSFIIPYAYSPPSHSTRISCLAYSTLSRGYEPKAQLANCETMAVANQWSRRDASHDGHSVPGHRQHRSVNPNFSQRIWHCTVAGHREYYVSLSQDPDSFSGHASMQSTTSPSQGQADMSFGPGGYENVMHRMEAQDGKGFLKIPRHYESEKWKLDIGMPSVLKIRNSKQLSENVIDEHVRPSMTLFWSVLLGINSQRLMKFTFFIYVMMDTC